MSNPFADRISQAAQEGYVNSTPRNYSTGRVTAVAPAPAPATPKQIGFIVTLLGERDYSGETRVKFLDRLNFIAANWDTELGKMTRVQASELISYLMTMPKIETDVPTATPSDVPVGRYAVVLYDELVFVKVDRPVEGQWAGRTFVTQQVSDDFMRVSRSRQDAMLDQIRSDGFEKAMTRYGRYLGVCGDCGKTLTNAESREEGIGPVCRSKNGW